MNCARLVPIVGIALGHLGIATICPAGTINYVSQNRELATQSQTFDIGLNETGNVLDQDSALDFGSFIRDVASDISHPAATAHGSAHMSSVLGPASIHAVGTAHASATASATSSLAELAQSRSFSQGTIEFEITDPIGYALRFEVVTNGTFNDPSIEALLSIQGPGLNLLVNTKNVNSRLIHEQTGVLAPGHYEMRFGAGSLAVADPFVNGFGVSSASSAAYELSFVVPEPSTLLLLMAGAAGLRRRRR